jgi:hypothetical protein
MGAVQARMHYSMRQEFKLLKAIIADYTPDEYDYEPLDAGRMAKRGDYDMVDVIPVSDPNASTMAQKIVQYQAALQLAQTAPQLYDMPMLHRQMIEVLGIKNANKLIPVEDDQKPTDPVQENQNFLTGKPVKAFIEQDHQAHISVHQAMMQDPHIMQMMGQNPQAQSIQAAAQAHMAEHLAFEYRRKIEQTIGLSLPTGDEAGNMDPGTADQVAQLSAQAAQQLLQQHMAQAAQQQQQQQQQDPIIQMQMQELQLKQQELQLKAQKQQQEAQVKAQQLQLEVARIASQKEIAAMQVGATAAAAKDKLHKSQELEGMKLGVDIQKHRAQIQQQRTQANLQRTASFLQKNQPTTKKEK